MVVEIASITSDYSPVGYGCVQRQLWYANGRYWVMYCDGTNALFRSCTDGFTWNSATTSVAVNRGYKDAIYWDGSYVYHVYANSTNTGNSWKRGTCNSDGTITWGTVRTLPNPAVSTYRSKPNTCLDTNGYPWALLMASGSGGIYRPYPVKATATDGSTWGTPVDVYSSQVAAAEAGGIYPLSSGNMVIIWNDGANLYLAKYNGSSWDASPTTISSSLAFGAGYCACADTANDNLYIVFNDGTNLKTTKWNYTSGLGTVYTVVLAPTATAYVTCTWDSGDSMYIIYSSGDRYVYYMKQTGVATFNSPVSVYDAGSDVNLREISSWLNVTGSRASIAFFTGTATPFSLKSEILTFLTNISITKKLVYSLLNLICINKQCVYEVLRRVSNVRLGIADILLPFELETAVNDFAPAKFTSYQILAAVYNSKKTIYGILSAIGSTKKQIYNIFNKVGSSDKLIYSVFNKTTSAKRGIYNIINIVGSSDRLIYSIRTRITTGDLYAYNVFNKIYSTKRQIYNIFNIITRTKAVWYNVINKITSSDKMIYNIIGRTIGWKVLHYSVREFVHDFRRPMGTFLLPSQLESATTSEPYCVYTPFEYHLRNLTAPSGDLLVYQIRKGISETNLVIYHIMNIVRSHDNLIYNVMNLANQKKKIVYALLNKTGSSKKMVYEILNKTSATKRYIYNVLYKIGTIDKYIYSVFGRVGTTDKYVYNVSGFLVSTKRLMYEIRNNIFEANRFVWNTAGLVTRTETISYRILSMVHDFRRPLGGFLLPSQLETALINEPFFTHKKSIYNLRNTITKLDKFVYSVLMAIGTSDKILYIMWQYARATKELFYHEFMWTHDYGLFFDFTFDNLWATNWFWNYCVSYGTNYAFLCGPSGGTAYMSEMWPYTGKMGYALRGRGGTTKDYARISSFRWTPPLSVPNIFSIDAWVYFETVPFYSNSFLFNYGGDWITGSTTTYQTFRVCDSTLSTDKVSIHYWNSATAWANGTLVGTTTIVPNQWYHLCATYDGTTIKLYLDGNLEAEKIETGGFTWTYGTPTYSFNIFAPISWSGNGFSARVDEVRLYNYAISEGMIDEHVNLIYDKPGNTRSVYEILSMLGAQKKIVYEILAKTGATRILWYGIAGSLLTTRRFVYGIRELVHDFRKPLGRFLLPTQLEYVTVNEPYSVDNRTVYDLRNLVVPSGKNILYSIRYAIGKASRSIYSIRNLIATGDRLIYTINNFARNRKTIVYNLSGLARNTIRLIYTLKETIYAKRVLWYNIVGSLLATRKFVYGIRELVHDFGKPLGAFLLPAQLESLVANEPHGVFDRYNYQIRTTTGVASDTFKYTIFEGVSAMKKLIYTMFGILRTEKKLLYNINKMVLREIEYLGEFVLPSRLGGASESPSMTIPYIVKMYAKRGVEAWYNIRMLVHAFGLRADYSLRYAIGEQFAFKYVLRNWISQNRQPLGGFLLPTQLEDVRHDEPRPPLLGFIWTMRGYAKSSKRLLYHLVTRISITKRVVYNIRLSLYNTKSMQYSILSRLAATKRLKYSVRKALSSNKHIRYNILGQITKGKTIKYTLRNFVSASTDTIMWSMIARVKATSYLRWSIYNRLTAKKTFKYGIRNLLARTRTVVYKIRTPVGAKAKSFMYSIRSRLGSTKKLQYTIFVFARVVTRLRWSMFNFTSRKITLKYYLHGALARAVKQVVYTIRNRARTSFKARYSIYAFVKSQRRFVYRIRNVITRQRTLVYKLREAIASNALDIIYSLRNKIRTTDAYQYSLRNYARGRVRVRYAIYVYARRTRSVLYRIRNLTGVSDTGLIYTIRNKISSTESVLYRITNLITARFRARYSIRTLLQRMRTVVYQVLAATGTSSKELRYPIRTAIGTGDTMIYSVINKSIGRLRGVWNIIPWYSKEHGIDPYMRLREELYSHLVAETLPGGEFEGFRVYKERPTTTAIFMPCLIIDVPTGEVGPELYGESQYSEGCKMRVEIIFSKTQRFTINM